MASLQAVGKVIGFTEKSNGWHEFELQTSNGVVEVATKKPDLLEIAKQAVNWPAAQVYYNEKQGKSKGDGTFYLDRYLERIEPADPAQAPPIPPTPPATQASVGFLKPRHPDEQRLICRQSLIKAALDFFAQSMPTTVDVEEVNTRISSARAAADELTVWAYEKPPEDVSGHPRVKSARENYAAQTDAEGLKRAMEAIAMVHGSFPSPEVYKQALSAVAPYAANYPDRQGELMKLSKFYQGMADRGRMPEDVNF